MISKPILKQTIRENRTLWIIVTGVLAGLMVLMSIVLSPDKLSAITNLMKETPLGKTAGFSEKIGSMGSFLGLLSQNYYGMIAIILAMLYVIIVANKLIASQIDRGSMAYTLSTPTKRNTVTFTQAIFLAGSIILMWLFITVIGIFAIDRFQSPIFDTSNTKDVKEVAKVLDIDKATLTKDLWLITENEDAIEAGAKARGLDEDSYTTYIAMAMERNAMTAATYELDVDYSEVKENPSMILEDDKATEAAAEIMHMDSEEYRGFLKEKSNPVLLNQGNANPNIGMEAMKEMHQEKLQLSLKAAADELKMELSDVTSDLMLVKDNQDAVKAAASTMGLEPEVYEGTVLNRMIAEMELAADEEEPFSVENFIYLNMGMCLLLLLISGISYFASCTFNLSKNSIAIGAGIPLTSYIFKLVGDMSKDLEIFSYLSIHSLFDTSAVLNGDGFVFQYILMGVITIILFAFAILIFRKKDLPL